MTKEVMKQEQDDSFNYVKKVIEALYENSDPVSVEAAELLERIIAKQEQGEPVAEVVEDNFSRQIVGIGAWRSLPNWTKLYTKPQQRKPLTDKQLSVLLGKIDKDSVKQLWSLRYFARAIEAAHGIKE